MILLPGQWRKKTYEALPILSNCRKGKEGEGFVARQMPRTEAPLPALLLWEGERRRGREATGKRRFDIYSAVGRGDPQKLAAIRSAEITG